MSDAMASPVPSIADALMSALADLGVTQVWAGPGGGRLVEAAARSRQTLLQAPDGGTAAYAAAAGAAAGGFGVCVLPDAVAVLQGLEAVQDAAQRRRALLLLRGRPPLADPDRPGGLDLEAALSDLGPSHQTVTGAGRLGPCLALAVLGALQDGGVATLTVPWDVAALAHPAPATVTVHPAVRPAPEPHALDLAVQVLQDSSRVSLLVTESAVAARDEVLALAERLAAPMVLTLGAKGALDADNPYAVGVAGTAAGRRAVEDADVLLVLGGDLPPSEWPRTDGQVVQVDLRPDAADVDVPVVGEAVQVARALVDRVSPGRDRSHLEATRAAYLDQALLDRALLDRTLPDRASDGAAMTPSATGPDVRGLVTAVDRACPDDAAFTAESGPPRAWLARWLRGTGRRAVLDVGEDTRGSALAQALGVQAARPGTTVVAVTQPSGLLARPGGLTAAVRHGLPVRLLVVREADDVDGDDAAAVAAALGWDVVLASGSRERGEAYGEDDGEDGAEGWPGLGEALARWLAAPGPSALVGTVVPGIDLR